MTKQTYTYDELDEILRGDGRNDNIGISNIDGLIAALVAGPAFVPPQQWLPLIFAGRLPTVVADTPEHLAVNTIFARYNEVSTIQAESPQAYRPMFMTDAGRIIAGHWAAGFVRGIALRPEAWSEILLTDMRTKLTPIFVSHEVGAGFLPDVPRAEQLRLRPDAYRHIADAVVELRAACNPLRAATFESSRTRGPRRR